MVASVVYTLLSEEGVYLSELIEPLSKLVEYMRVVSLCCTLVV